VTNPSGHFGPIVLVLKCFVVLKCLDTGENMAYDCAEVYLPSCHTYNT